MGEPLPHISRGAERKKKKKKSAPRRLVAGRRFQVAPWAERGRGMVWIKASISAARRVLCAQRASSTGSLEHHVLAAGHPEIFGYRWQIRGGCAREFGVRGGLLLLFFPLLPCLLSLQVIERSLKKKKKKSADPGLLEGFISTQIQ